MMYYSLLNVKENPQLSNSLLKLNLQWEVNICRNVIPLTKPYFTKHVKTHKKMLSLVSKKSNIGLNYIGNGSTLLKAKQRQK